MSNDDAAIGQEHTINCRSHRLALEASAWAGDKKAFDASGARLSPSCLIARRAATTTGGHSDSDQDAALSQFFPGIPEPQKRPRVFQSRGRTLAWSPKSKWRTSVLAQAMPNRPEKPYDIPLYVRIIFLMPIPKSDPTRQGPHTVKPDLDNLSKAVLDALKDAGWFVDDSRIAHLETSKYYAKVGVMPGCYVLVGRLP